MELRRLSSFFSFLAFLFHVSCLYGISQSYSITPNDSHIGFTATHMGFHKVTGRFHIVSGMLIWDNENTNAGVFMAHIQTSSMDTQNKIRDKHLKSDEFFDSERYPLITFQSTRIYQKDTQWICVGLLDMHGARKEIQIPFTFLSPPLEGAGELHITASFLLDRADFGITHYARMIKNEVEISLQIKAKIIP